MKCFFEVRKPTSVDLIDGFSNLRYNDQVEIQQYVGNIGNEKETALFAQSYKEQNDKFFAVYDKVRVLTCPDQIEFLKKNNQFVHENEAEVSIVVFVSHFIAFSIALNSHIFIVQFF